MTRETKSGLVVSLSFVCLVGAVLALKLKQAGAAAGDPAPEDAEMTALTQELQEPQPVAEPAPPAPPARPNTEPVPATAAPPNNQPAPGVFPLAPEVQLTNLQHTNSGVSSALNPGLPVTPPHAAPAGEPGPTGNAVTGAEAPLAPATAVAIFDRLGIARPGAALPAAPIQLPMAAAPFPPTGAQSQPEAAPPAGAPTPALVGPPTSPASTLAGLAGGPPSGSGTPSSPAGTSPTPAAPGPTGTTTTGTTKPDAIASAGMVPSPAAPGKANEATSVSSAASTQSPGNFASVPPPAGGGGLTPGHADTGGMAPGHTDTGGLTPRHSPGTEVPPTVSTPMPAPIGTSASAPTPVPAAPAVSPPTAVAAANPVGGGLGQHQGFDNVPPVSPTPIMPGPSTEPPHATTPSPASPPDNLLAQASAPAPGGPTAAHPTPPPIGTPAAVASPPIAVPSPSGAPAYGAAPSVEAYDETTYRAQAGDTLPSVSKKYLGSENYAAALLLYNREHPQNQVQTADGLRRDPPALVPGQPVFIPPLYILEKRYPAAVNLPPLPNPAPATPPAAAGALAPPSTAFSPQAAAPTPAPAAPGFGLAKQYRVRQSSGESYYEIARRTLNDGNRWTDIFNLNRSISPDYPVPAGTVLNMPSDAVIGPENAP